MKKPLIVVLCMVLLTVTLGAICEEKSLIGASEEMTQSSNIEIEVVNEEEGEICEEEVPEIESALYLGETKDSNLPLALWEEDIIEESTDDNVHFDGTMAEPNNTYTINGKTVYATMVSDPGNGQCWAYANSIYNIIWGVRFDSSFSGDSGTGYNMLRNLSDGDRTLTTTHLKDFIAQAALGASIRIGGCTSSCSHFNDDGLNCGHSGHSLILVAKNDGGFTTFERLTGPGRREKTWTWDSFCSAYSGYPYIKYIKWPGAKEYTGNSSPIAVLDYASASEGKLWIRGWAFDPDSKSVSLPIHVYVKDAAGTMSFVGQTVANTSRTDVNNVYQCGNYHGFDAELLTKDLNGTYTVCVAALDTDGGSATWVNKENEHFTKDTTAPCISNVSIESISSTGYRVIIQATDNISVTSVKVPTWRASLGGNYAEWPEAVQTGDTTWICDVKRGLEEQTYYSDVYAYDYQGNVIKAEGTIQHANLNVSFNANGGTCSTYEKKISAMWFAGTPLQTYGELPIPEKQGYEFISWKAEATDGELVTGASLVKNKKDHTLYAVWQALYTASPESTIKPVTTTKPTSVPTMTPAPTSSPTQTPTAPIKVALNKTKVTLGVKETLKLTAKLTPSDAKSSLKWSSSNPIIATVNQDGLITAKKVGTTKITVTTSNGKRAKSTVTVKAAPTKVKLNKKGTVTLKKGKTLKLKATLPNKTASALTWTSSNSSVATVDQNGKVRAIAKGTTTIVVRTFNKKKATVKIRVK